MKKIFINKQNCLEHTGYTPEELAQFTGIEAYTQHYTYQIDGTNTAPRVTIDSDDRNVHLRRTYLLEVNEVDNDRFEINGTNRGVGRKIFREQVRLLSNTPFTKITCIASKTKTLNGHYTWARFGYIIDEDERQDITDYFYLVNYNCSENQPHKIVTDQTHRFWWKENGITWTGFFDLAEGSESKMYFQKYLLEKELP